jgi:hypothetical protein
MMPDASLDYREITRLSNSELARCTQDALDSFIQEAIKQGGDVAEKARIYNAYQDERLRRITPLNLIKSPLPEKSRFGKGIILRR